MDAWEMLNKKIEAAGGPRRKVNSLGIELTAVDQILNFGIACDDWVDLMESYYGRLKYIGEKTSVLRAIGTAKSVIARQKVAKFLLAVLKESYSEDGIAWTAANSLRIVKVPETFPTVMRMVTQSKYGTARQPLLELIPKSNMREARRILVSLLKDEDVFGHAITALGKLGDPTVISALQKLEIPKGHFANRARVTALARLKKKQGRAAQRAAIP